MVSHEKALDFFKANQTELVKKYNGKTLVLNGNQILEVSDSCGQAYELAMKKYGEGNFSLQKVRPGKDAFTVSIATPGIIGLT